MYPVEQCDDLRIRVSDELAKWRPGMVVPLRMDLKQSVSEQLWPQTKNARKTFGGLLPQHLRHGALFYAYRNGLVHEVRSLGHGIDDDDESDPHYHSMSWPDRGNEIT